MANHNVEYKLTLVSNMQQQLNIISQESKQTASSLDVLGNVAKNLNSIFHSVSSVWSTVAGAAQQCIAANQAQQEAETKLAQVMRNTMDASDAQIQSIKDLAAAQQALGVVGDEVQLAGAQELGTYLEKTESLQKLMPVMNDMIAQQYGLNASQESAVNIATMMGKVMEGQTGALSRYGYKFSEAQEYILKYGTEAQKVATLSEVITESVGGMNAALAASPEGRMQQMANRMGDLRERVGALFVHIQAAFAPLMNCILSAGERLAAWVEQHEQIIIGAVGKVQGVLYGTYNFLRRWSPLLIGLGVAITAVTIAVKGATVATNIAKTATALWSAAQAVLNVILTANPVGLIIAAVAVLVGWVAVIIKNWERWGAAITLFMGPLGRVIALVQSFRKHWDSIVEAFQVDGIVAGFKRIGAVTLDALLMPLQQLMQTMVDLPGVGKLAQKALNKITATRERLGLSTADKAAAATEGKTDSTGSNTLASLVSGGASGRSGGDEMAASAQAVATGGKRTTNIYINIGDMIREVNFNGTTSENEKDIERTFAQCLSRVLALAGQ